MILNGLFDCNLDSELCEMKAAAGTVISVSTGWSGVLKKITKRGRWWPRMLTPRPASTMYMRTSTTRLGSQQLPKNDPIPKKRGPWVVETWNEIRHALWICGHAPFHFQWHCSNIMGSAKLSRPAGRCAEAWRLSHVWHTHRHFCHRRMGDLYSLVLRNISIMKCCHTVMLFRVCFILFHGMCMHFVHGWACKEALVFCAWNTSKNCSLCAERPWEFINPVLYVSCKLSPNSILHHIMKDNTLTMSYSPHVHACQA